jgi:heme-degrading monooxygenase HmoA
MSYYAVVFTSQRTPHDGAEYETMAKRMLELARTMPGFLDVESARSDDGVGITVSYWQDLDSIRRWREQAEHQAAQHLGRTKWYEWYKLRICQVEAEYEKRSGAMTDGTEKESEK